MEHETTSLLVDDETKKNPQLRAKEVGGTTLEAGPKDYGSAEGQLEDGAQATTGGVRMGSSSGTDEQDGDDNSDDDNNNKKKQEELYPFTIICILATAFSYGCVLTTLFLITLPIECERINIESNGTTPKSVVLGIFVGIAGFTQLISPLVGRISDMYEPPHLLNNNNNNINNNNNGDRGGKGFVYAEVGQRLPYYIIGGFLSVAGLLCQMFASQANLWIRYGTAFFFSMVGLNIQYAMMLALIPDQVPRHQTGVANGILALMLVLGSLFGFGLFHAFLSQDVGGMYGLYSCIVIVTTIMTCTHAHDRDVALALERLQLRNSSSSNINATTMMPGGPDEQPPATAADESQSSSVRAAAVGLDRPSMVMASPPWPRKARRATRKAVKHAVKTAKDFVLTPAIIMKSMTDPFHKMNWASLLSSYTIDTEKYHDFFIVTVSRLFYYCGMSVQTFFLYFVHDIIGIRTNPEAAVASLAMILQCSGAFTCYPVGVISDRFMNGRRKPFVYFSCAVLASATLTLVFATTFQQMVVFCIILGAANGAYLTMDTSLAVDTLPEEFDGSGESGSAQLLGVWGVAAFLGSGLGPMIGGPLLYIIGSKDDNGGPDEAEEYTLKGYAVVLSLSAFYFACSALTLRFIRNHNK